MNTSQDPLTLLSRLDDLPPDVVAEIQTFAAHTLTRTELKKLQADLFCRAAALLPADYGITRKGAVLAAIARRCRKPTNEVSRLILEAGKYGRLPDSEKTYARKIQKGLGQKT